MPAANREYKLSEQEWKNERRRVTILAQRKSPLTTVRELLRRRSAGGSQRTYQCSLKSQLQISIQCGVGNFIQKRQAASQMLDRFGMRRTLRRSYPRLEPGLDGFGVA